MTDLVAELRHIAEAYLDEFPLFKTQEICTLAADALEEKDKTIEQWESRAKQNAATAERFSAELRKANGEIERLTAELQGTKDELYSVDKAAKELGADRDRLTRELAKFQHHIACQFQVTGGLEPCDCGLDDAERRAGDHAEEIVRLAAKCDRLVAERDRLRAQIGYERTQNGNLRAALEQIRDFKSTGFEIPALAMRNIARKALAGGAEERISTLSYNPYAVAYDYLRAYAEAKPAMLLKDALVDLDRRIAEGKSEGREFPRGKSCVVCGAYYYLVPRCGHRQSQCPSNVHDWTVWTDWRDNVRERECRKCSAWEHEQR